MRLCFKVFSMLFGILLLLVNCMNFLKFYFMERNKKIFLLCYLLYFEKDILNLGFWLMKICFVY